MLVDQAASGNFYAFGQLYEMFLDKIYRYAYYQVKDKMTAEDITETVFMKAWKQIATCKGQGATFSAWLYRIAHNQVVDHWRKKSRRPTVPIDETIAAGDSDPRHEAERKMEIEELAVATQKLTAAQREVISLRFAGELSVAEVARVMGRSEGAIKALQHSAIAALRRVLAVEVAR